MSLAGTQTSLLLILSVNIDWALCDVVTAVPRASPWLLDERPVWNWHPGASCRHSGHFLPPVSTSSALFVAPWTISFAGWHLHLRSEARDESWGTFSILCYLRRKSSHSRTAVMTTITRRGTIGDVQFALNISHWPSSSHEKCLKFKIADYGKNSPLVLMELLFWSSRDHALISTTVSPKEPKSPLPARPSLLISHLLFYRERLRICLKRLL